MRVTTCLLATALLAACFETAPRAGDVSRLTEVEYVSIQSHRFRGWADLYALPSLRAIRLRGPRWWGV